MKSFTDLEQSKKLAEFLPIESADMCYIQDLLAGSKYGDYKPYVGNLIPAYGQGKIRCWSLAALLEALPTIDDGNRNPVVCKDIRLNKWHIVYYSTAVEAKIDSGVYDSLVDACYEMILKLHELNLL